MAVAVARPPSGLISRSFWPWMTRGGDAHGGAGWRSHSSSRGQPGERITLCPRIIRSPASAGPRARGRIRTVGLARRRSMVTGFMRPMRGHGVELMQVRDRTQRGSRIASVWAIMPPTQWPTTWALDQSRARGPRPRRRPILRTGRARCRDPASLGGYQESQPTPNGLIHRSCGCSNRVT
jgi:hypothetical protein